MSEVRSTTSLALVERSGFRCREFPFVPRMEDVADRFPQGPSGIGTSAAHLARTISRAGTASTRDKLRCPPALRHDPVLERAVNDGLVEWAGQVGVFPGRLDALRKMNFGQLITLTYVDTDDYDRLLAVTRMTLA